MAVSRRGALAPAAAGVLFALLYVVSLFGVLDLPEGTDDDAAVQAAFADAGGIIVGVYLVAAAGLAFLVFLGGLRSALPDAGWLRDACFAGGIAYVSMLFAAAAAWGVLAFGTALDELPEPVDPQVARALTNLGFTLLLVFGLLAAALTIATASVAILRGGGLPRWLGWAGVVSAPLLLLGPFYMPQILVPAWVAAASVALWRRPAVPASV